MSNNYKKHRDLKWVANLLSKPSCFDFTCYAQKGFPDCDKNLFVCSIPLYPLFRTNIENLRKTLLYANLYLGGYNVGIVSYVGPVFSIEDHYRKFSNLHLNSSQLDIFLNQIGKEASLYQHIACHVYCNCGCGKCFCDFVFFWKHINNYLENSDPLQELRVFETNSRKMVSLNCIVNWEVLKGKQLYSSTINTIEKSKTRPYAWPSVFQ